MKRSCSNKKKVAIVGSHSRVEYAANVRVDVGSPLVVAAQTRADLLKDAGFVFERGEAERQRLLSQADIEKQLGKLAYRQSRWQSQATIGQGLGSLGMTIWGS